MKSHLVDLERQALELQNSGHHRQAAELWQIIIQEQPDWEHGEAFYNLAGCHEDLGDSVGARHYYSKAITCGPSNWIFWGGYASFLYLQGDFRESFEAHLKLLKLDRADPQASGTIRMLRTLAQKIGVSNIELEQRIDEP